jgi:3-methylcrotonyl-CoA carboxylase alpha subunit
MPGQVISIEIALDETVASGQKLMVLEAMKMEHSITAPFDGIVREIGPALGDQVSHDALLIRIEAPQKAPEE